MPAAPARRALAAAITTVLAVGLAVSTCATAVAAAPAASAPAPASFPAQTPARTVPRVPVDVEVVGSGPSGFLGTTPTGGPDRYALSYRWYRPDGTSTPLPSGAGGSTALPNALASDLVAVVEPGRRVVGLRDMSASSGTPPVVLDLTTLGPTHTYAATIGSTLLVESGPANGPKELHLVSRNGDGSLSDRRVTGVPAAFGSTAEVRAVPGGVLVAYHSNDADWHKTAVLVVDPASAAVTGVLPPSADDRGEYRPVALSATRIARWQGEDVVVTDRATGTSTSVTVGREDGARVLGFSGDWLLHGRSTPVGGGWAGDALLPLTARSLADGRTVTLLDRVSGLAPAPGGALLARGGTVGKGEGVYRIAPGPDGVPTAELVASTGESTALAFTGTNVGPVLDLDAQGGSYLTWRLSHGGYSVRIELIHQRTGQLYRHETESAYAETDLVWPGVFGLHGNDLRGAALNGDYTWELTAKPHNGIGPDLHATGDFEVVRTPKLHDFNDNGSPDLLVRDGSGNLRRVDTVYDHRKDQVVAAGEPVLVGGGWQGYRQIESVGDVAGTTAPDVIGVDGGGILWLHQGTGDGAGPLADRIRIGGGWQVYDRLTGGSDLTGDGRADLVAVDKAGDLYLYRGTGKASAPFAPRKKIGFGWNVYDRLTAVGNVAGAAAGDLVARDRDGVLWLYLGKGDGTYTARTRIGAGWNQYTHFIGIGEPLPRQRAALLAYDARGGTAYVYRSTGYWEQPFYPRQATGLSFDGTYNLFR
ncbi:VCBS repeat-containing protein [Streptomyces sp. NPDC088757]|uniref:VCBS repeat-containing protein n=1 Tax=Streptomyces sp. NPDC088757 TaxID=3365889 RepID=UPI0037FF8731